MMTIKSNATTGSLLTHAWVLALREIQHWRLQLGMTLIGWFFPIMILLMFGGLFGGAMTVSDGGNYFDFLMPGMFTVTMFFGFESTMTAITTDASKGITDRFRSMPMHDAAVLLGRCIADMLNSVVSLSILIVAGLILGWRWHGSILEALAAVGLLLLLRFALLWIGIFIGINAKGPEALMGVQILVWPISFLSSIYVDPTTMPSWLGTIASWNPLSVTSSAIRQLFGNPGWGGESWIAQNGVLMAVVLPILITLIFMPLAANKYRHLRR